MHQKTKKILILSAALLFVLLAVHKAQAEIVVAVLDTGYTNPKESVRLCPIQPPDFSGSNASGDADKGRHGSNVASLIARNAGPKGYCIQIFKIFTNIKGKLSFSMVAYLQSLLYLNSHKVDLINLSVSGVKEIKEENVILKRLLDKNIIIVAAAGNDSIDLNKTGCVIYPACADSRIIMVANSESSTSNFGRYIDIYENGMYRYGAGVILSGTSQAAAVVSGNIVKKAVKSEKK